MKKSTKIILSISISFVVVIGIIIGAHIIDFSTFDCDCALEYVLYTIGYGELNDCCLYTQLFMAILGIILVSLISSYITVFFIEQKSKLKVGKKFNICTDKISKAVVILKTKLWNLYDIEIKLIYSYNGHFYEESQRIPYLGKHSQKEVTFDIVQGSVLYWYFLSCLNNKDNIGDIILKIDFVNSKNNQSYSYVNKYDIKDFITNEKSSIDAIIKDACDLSFDFEHIAICEKKYIEIDTTEQKNEKESRVTATVNLKDENPDSFGMIFFRKPFLGDWRYLVNENYTLVFDVKNEGNLDLKIQIKNSRGITIKEESLNADFAGIKLRDESEAKFSDINEMCFVAFKKQQNHQDAQFTISNCRFEKDNKESEQMS